MNWEKVGQIYYPDSNSKFLKTHAANPTPVKLNDKGLYRVFFNGRDKNNRSSVGYIDYDFDNLNRVSDESKLLLSYGGSESFYSHGISLGNYWRFDGHLNFGFMAWQIRGDEHWRGDIGVFKLNDSLDQTIGEPKLLLGVNEEDKISLSYPFVIFDKSENVYKMLYGSTTTWDAGNNEMIHTIKLTKTRDFKQWQFFGTVLNYQLGIKQAFSRPSLIKINNKFYCWFSYRSGDGSKYKIGSAESDDLLNWKYIDSELKKSKFGWDSEMVCYPYVFKHKRQIYMLYNGNEFGKTGIGLAKLIK